MIAKLKGTVIDVRLMHIVLDVGGVGYLVAVRNPLSFQLKSAAELHTHLAVRESAMDLYGFSTRDELEMFEQLLRLPKIGPKSAMQILSQAEIELIKRAIATDDAAYLSKMSGIGKKSAEKIVSGLKDVFDGYAEEARHEEGMADSDVVEALLSLGYSQKDAREALKNLPKGAVTANDRLREALKNLGSNS